MAETIKRSITSTGVAPSGVQADLAGQKFSVNKNSGLLKKDPSDSSKAKDGDEKSDDASSETIKDLRPGAKLVSSTERRISDSVSTMFKNAYASWTGSGAAANKNLSPYGQDAYGSPFGPGQTNPFAFNPSAGKNFGNKASESNPQAAAQTATKSTTGASGSSGSGLAMGGNNANSGSSGRPGISGSNGFSGSSSGDPTISGIGRSQNDVDPEYKGAPVDNLSIATAASSREQAKAFVGQGGWFSDDISRAIGTGQSLGSIINGIDEKVIGRPHGQGTQTAQKYGAELPSELGSKSNPTNGFGIILIGNEGQGQNTSMQSDVAKIEASMKAIGLNVIKTTTEAEFVKAHKQAAEKGGETLWTHVTAHGNLDKQVSSAGTNHEKDVGFIAIKADNGNGTNFYSENDLIPDSLVGIKADGSDPFTHRVTTMDTCHSGAFDHQQFAELNGVEESSNRPENASDNPSDNPSNNPKPENN